MEINRITPNKIESLQENEIFVFGSNLAGVHGGGAARTARMHYGAIMGQGVGLQGKSYAIPTMQGGIKTIKPYVDEFIQFAKEHPEKKFLVTRIGCGIAGFKDEEIAPLFLHSKNVSNIYLPESFWRVILTMKTEINGDWIGYLKRFKLPTIKAFLYPLKATGIIFLSMLILSIILMIIPTKPVVKFIPIMSGLLVSICFYIKIHYKIFWNNVLEESQGLFADLLMWLYYFIICIVSIAPAIISLSFILQ